MDGPRNPSGDRSARPVTVCSPRGARTGVLTHRRLPLRRGRLLAGSGAALRRMAPGRLTAADSPTSAPDGSAAAHSTAESRPPKHLLSLSNGGSGGVLVWMFLSVPTSCAVSRTSRRRSIVGLEGICGRPQTFDGGLGTTLAAQPGGVRVPRRFLAAVRADPCLSSPDVGK